MILMGDALIECAKQVFGDIPDGQIGVVSVDVRLDGQIWKDNGRGSVIDLASIPKDIEMYHVIEVPQGFAFELHAGGFIKARTTEIFNMPPNIAAMFSLRSCLAQAGLEQSTSVWIRPGWQGQLILELCNFRPRSLIIRPGMLIGQVHFFQCNNSVRDAMLELSTTD